MCLLRQLFWYCAHTVSICLTTHRSSSYKHVCFMTHITKKKWLFAFFFSSHHSFYANANTICFFVFFSVQNNFSQMRLQQRRDRVRWENGMLNCESVHRSINSRHETKTNAISFVKLINLYWHGCIIISSVVFLTFDCLIA